MKNLLIYTLFKKVPEQSGNNMISYAKYKSFWKFPETSQWFHLLPDVSIGMEKKILGNSRLFRKLPWQYIFNF